MTQHRNPEAAREAGITYHLVPRAVWEVAHGADAYVPETFAADGYIHCTDGTDQLLTVANMYYVSDPREFRVLVLDIDRIQADVRYDDPDRIFPHIYGPLNTSAVIDELAVSRADDGTFVAIGPM